MFTRDELTDSKAAPVQMVWTCCQSREFVAARQLVQMPTNALFTLNAFRVEQTGLAEIVAGEDFGVENKAGMNTRPH